MKDLSEAELIEIERRSMSLVETLEAYPEEMRNIQLVNAFNSAFDQAEAVARDVAELCEHLRAVSIETQKMENLAAKDAA